MKALRSFLAWSMLVGAGGVATASCDSSFDTDAEGSDGGGPRADGAATDASAPLDDAGSYEGDAAQAADAGACLTEPYSPKKPITEGLVCGVGSCRKHLFGAACAPPSAPDGGDVVSRCASVYPVEDLTNDLDDDCDGVIDEGRPSPVASAGFECTTCAFGRDVQRHKDGALENKSGPAVRTDYRNSADCINSSLCKLGAPQWVRNVEVNGKVGFLTCDAFCGTLGATCQNACSTAPPTCTGAGIGTNLGVFAADYNCVVPKNPYGAKEGTPLTGSCTDTLDTRIVNSSVDFNVQCCCAM